MAAREARSEKLDVRLTASAKLTLQSAAKAASRSVSEFLVESALARADELLPDRRRFELDSRRWAEFQAALDAPPRHLPRMAALLAERSDES